MIKALSLWQPWATLVAIGAKQIETRCWHTGYRGPLAIAATASTKPSILKVAMTFPTMRTALLKAGLSPADSLPNGCVLAIADLTDCLLMEDGMLYKMPMKHYVRDWPSEHDGDKLGAERSFGDYRDGRYAWILENVRRLPTPIPAKGSQLLWDWDEGKPRLIDCIGGKGDGT